MTRKASISVSFILLSAFALFNAGMPVSFYLCPMMSDEMPMCDCSPAAAEGLSFTSVTPDCCAKVFIAERKTTPFLKTTEAVSGQDSAFLSPMDVLTPDGPPVLFTVSLLARPEADSPPLFLLHSSLLI